MSILCPSTQDEVLTVRSLLQTRCESNSVIFNQLIKGIGQEGQGGGQATALVFNSSVISAKPTSVSSSNPLTQVSQAWSKVGNGLVHPSLLELFVLINLTIIHF